MSEQMLKDLKEAFNKSFEDFKKENDKALETKSALNKEYTDKLGKQIDEIQLKFKEMELEAKKNEIKEKKLCIGEEVKSYIKYGMDALPEETRKKLVDEQKATLIAGDNALGGYLVRKEYANEILKLVTEMNPIREWARVVQISRRSYPIDKRASNIVAGWTGELGAVQKSNSTYAQDEIVAHSLSVVAPISTELLQDSEYNMESETSLDVAEATADKEGTAFVTGDDVQKPQGFINSDIELLDTAGSGVLASDDLYSLIFKLKSAYAKNGSAFFGNRQILAAIRKFKGSDGQYIVSTSQTGKISFDLFNYPFVELPAMDSTIATGKKVLAFGDMYRAYRIVDRIGMTVLRDPYSQKIARTVEFLFEKRVGGKVVMPEALKILKIKA